jgi:hypothetical protein
MLHLEFERADVKKAVRKVPPFCFAFPTQLGRLFGGGHFGADFVDFGLDAQPVQLT